MTSDLRGKTVIVTGAGGAMAASIITTLQSAGASLVLVGRHESLAGAAAQHPGAAVIEADLTRPEEARKLRDVPAFALVHTVGGFRMEPANEATPSDLQGMLSVNLHTLFHAVQAVLPGMLERREGRVLGISAGQAARGAGPGAALYTASKAAVAAYLRSLDAELREQGVRSSVIYPMGAVDTPANRAGGMNPAKMIDPHDVAASVLHVLTRTCRGHVDEVRLHPA